MISVSGTLAKEFVAANDEIVQLQGKTGKELDYALVRFEQSKVRLLVRDFVRKNSYEDVSKVMNEISSSFKWAPSVVRGVMKGGGEIRTEILHLISAVTMIELF